MSAKPTNPDITDQRHDLEPGWEAAHALELAITLQTTLDVDKVIGLFSTETRKHIPYDGLAYRNPELGLDLRLGNSARHKCTYRLLVADHQLGELEFSRSRKFTEDDSVQMEYMLSGLLYPLRNALLYHQALTKAMQDPLTGVNNRTCFEASLRREVNLAHRHDTPLAMIILDIDRFKSINDRLGHLVGDCVIRDVATTAAGCIRNTDIMFRYGGEEFVILLSNTEPDGARLLAERIRLTIERLCCNYGDTPIGVTVSMGVACLRQEENENALFERADAALYNAKNGGRNRTEFAGD